MKKLFLALFLCFSLSGCAGWVAEFRANPVAGLQSGVSYIQTALSLARGAFEIWAATAGESASETRLRFNEVAAQVDRGLLVAQDGLRVAAHAGGSTPDMNALLRDAQAAIGSLNSFLSGLPGHGPGGSNNPTMREAIQATEQASRPLSY